MSGPKESFAIDLDEATQMHRDSLYCVLVDYTKWLKRERDKFRKQSRTACGKGKLDRSDYLAAHAIALDAAYKKLTELRKKHGEQSALKSCIGHQRFVTDGPSSLLGDPSEAEIQTACESIRAGWSDEELARRGGTVAKGDVEIRVIKGGVR